MQITVEIPDEFAALARARGLTPESYARSLIESAVRGNGSRATVPHSEKERDRFFHELTAGSEKMPVLPDEASTRESFYQDHD
jgi:hypothetical protein